MEIPQMDVSSQRDGDEERNAAPKNSRTVSVEVVISGGSKEIFGAVRVEVAGEESNGPVGERVEVADLGAALETSCIESGGEKIIVASDVEVAATRETEQMQGRAFKCHQCRQMRKGAAAACKGGFKKNGMCILKYYERCVRNRYSTIADKAMNELAWECPRCQNNCNCSICMKNKGERATGPTVHPGRKRKGSVDAAPTNRKPLLGAENTDAPEDDIELPMGTLVTCVAGIELQPEDVGMAIQFLEFCRLFGEIFKIREGQPEQTLKEITGDRQLREVPSVVADFHINLLSIIEKGKAKASEYPRDGDEWIRKLGGYLVRWTLDAKDLTLDCLNQGVSGYKNISPSCKLDMLNFLCDEAFYSEWEKRDSVVHIARKKVDKLKKRHTDINKLMEGGETTSNEETKNIISQIKKANAEKKAAMNELEELGHVLKITPIRVEKGVAYWKLDGYYCSNNTNIMRQEFDHENTVKNKDKWFMFTEDEQKVIEDKLTKRSGRLLGNPNRV